MGGRLVILHVDDGLDVLGGCVSSDPSFAAMKRRFMVARDVEVSLMLKKPREADAVAAERVGERYIEAPPRPTAGRM